MQTDIEKAAADLLSAVDFARILPEFRRWQHVILHGVTFSLNSELHTHNHCSRVLLYELLMADALNLNAQDGRALAIAAVFHDTRRLDDGFDTGHGRRGADYYRAVCGEMGIPFDENACFAMAYHDRDDDFGIAQIRRLAQDPDKAVFLYKLFKDADALDRFRLGENMLDSKYLRTRAAKNLVGFAERLVSRTNPLSDETKAFLRRFGK